MLTPRMSNKNQSVKTFSSFDSSNDNFFEIDDDLVITSATKLIFQLISSERSRSEQGENRANIPQGNFYFLILIVMPELFVGGLDQNKSVSSVTTEEFKSNFFVK